MIGAYTMAAWGVVILDAYRDADGRVKGARPVRIGRNVWLGFECCVLPGVTIGDGSVVGARAVVVGDVPANGIVAGNPAEVVHRL